MTSWAVNCRSCHSPESQIRQMVRCGSRTQSPHYPPIVMMERVALNPSKLMRLETIDLQAAKKINWTSPQITHIHSEGPDQLLESFAPDQ